VFIYRTTSRSGCGAFPLYTRGSGTTHLPLMLIGETRTPQWAVGGHLTTDLFTTSEVPPEGDDHDHA
jgi:hypothetical protein